MLVYDGNACLTCPTSLARLLALTEDHVMDQFSLWLRSFPPSLLCVYYRSIELQLQ